MSIVCGHFNIVVRDRWILCQDCERGIDANSKQGQRLLTRKSCRKLDVQQEATFLALQESYRELCDAAGRTGPEVLADYANKGGEG